MLWAASSTITSRPPCARRRATARPTTPAPITTQSTRSMRGLLQRIYGGRQRLERQRQAKPLRGGQQVRARRLARCVRISGDDGRQNQAVLLLRGRRPDRALRRVFPCQASGFKQLVRQKVNKTREIGVAGGNRDGAMKSKVGHAGGRKVVRAAIHVIQRAAHGQQIVRGAPQRR